MVRNVVRQHGEEPLIPDIRTWTSAGRISMQLGAIQLADLEIAHSSAFILITTCVHSQSPSLYHSPVEIACSLISS